MKIFLKFLITISLIFSAAVFISGCVNIIQKVKLNEDGSGTISIRYWTKSENVTGDELLLGFAFTEEKVKSNYTSPNSKPSDIKIEKNVSSDSLLVVTLKVIFKDINNLSSAIAFKNTKVKYIDGKEGKEFKYVLLQDTTKIQEYERKCLIYHEFEFPGKVISTNGKFDINVNKTYWKNTNADLINDVEMIATIKCK